MSRTDMCELILCGLIFVLIVHLQCKVIGVTSFASLTEQ